MGDNQKRCQMSEEVKERNIALEMTVRIFFFPLLSWLKCIMWQWLHLEE